jgi:hypothetical protein
MDVYGVQLPPNAWKKGFAMHNAMHNSVVYDALAGPSDHSHVVESTCDPLTLTAAVCESVPLNAPAVSDQSLERSRLVLTNPNLFSAVRCRFKYAGA